MGDFSGGPIPGDLDVRWIHGSPARDGDRDPPIQVHSYDDHTYVLRQSKAVSREALFLYRFFGNGAALLLDTGASEDPTRFPLRETVDGIVSSWLAPNRETTSR